MTYNKYKDFITDALIDYCENGGSLVYLALHDLKKEYVFKFDESVAKDKKENLKVRAIKAIEDGKDLPPNIKLEKILIK